MGMFDRVMVPCPKCGTRSEFQSKSGACVLATHALEDAPDDVLVGIESDEARCEACGILFRVDVEVDPPRPRRTLFARSVAVDLADHDEQAKDRDE